MYVGTAPDMVMACSTDLWALRSHRATCPRVTLAVMITRLEVDEPLVTW